MTECNRKSISFSSLGRRKIETDFNGGDITSDAGGLLLREADRQLGLTDALADCVTDKRRKEKVTHSLVQMLRQRIYGIALGYEDLNDHDALRNDPLMQLLLDSDQKLASSPTLCRFENRIDSSALARMSRLFVETFIQSFDAPPEELVLDFDATDDEIHGTQEGRFFHGYYDSYCFLPLYVFCGEQLLVARLRESKIDAAKGAWGILSLLVKRFRQEWPNVKIIFRADGGFARWRMMRWCDKLQVGYIIGLPKNSRLAGVSEQLRNSSEKLFNETGVKQRLFGSFQYGALTWDVERRVIVKAEHSENGSNPRYLVTNLTGDAQSLYDELYVRRGEMENRIKEQQRHLFADRTSAHRFAANQMRLLLASAAYVLMEYIRRTALADTELARAQCDTIRLKLFKIGGRIIRSVRRIVIHLATGYPYRSVFTRAASLLLRSYCQ